jgi:hypothetical protein
MRASDDEGQYGVRAERRHDGMAPRDGRDALTCGVE